MTQPKGFAELNRRDFIKSLSAAGMFAGLAGMGLLQSCGSGSSPATPETRSLHLDLAHLEPADHDFTLVAGTAHYPMEAATATSITAAKRANRFVNLLPDGRITHHAGELTLPGDQIQLCHIRRTAKGDPHGPWTLAGYFLHIPTASLLRAHSRRNNGKLTSKALLYGLSYSAASDTDALHESNMITPADSATAFIFTHPELMSMEPDSAAHITVNIIGVQASSAHLSQVIQQQGESWMSSRGFTDPDTNLPYTDADGRPVMMPIPSDDTMRFGGRAMNDALQAAKQDTSLGVNISGVTDTATDMKGKIWSYQDGSTVTDANVAVGKQTLKEGAASCTLTNVCAGGGYKLALHTKHAETDADGNLVVELECVNSYLRYLGAYVQYRDASGAKIPASDITASVKNPSTYFSTLINYVPSDDRYSIYVKPLGPKLVVLGIPLQNIKEELIIPIPPNAGSFQLIANTLGHGDDLYKGLNVGVVMTAVFNLGFPSMFLVMGAAAGYSGFIQHLEKQMEALEGVEFCMELVADFVKLFTFKEKYAGIEIAIAIAEKLLGLIKSKKFVKMTAEITADLAVGDLTAGIPFLGQILLAINSAALVSDIAQTSVAAGLSPWNYVHTVSLTHQVTITIHPDVNHKGGFPASAKKYLITLNCNHTQKDANGNTVIIGSATPIQLVQPMPATTTSSLTVTIPDVPYGGRITVTVAFYSDSNWLAGHGEGTFDNTQDAFALTITETLVPIRPDTTYTYKEKSALDAKGRHIWQTGNVPAATPFGQCGVGSDQLCRVESLTASNSAAAVGYSWQAYGSQNGKSGQLYRFGGISTTETPESGAFQSTFGSSAPVRVVYDLVGELGASQRNFYLDADSGNIIRQVRLGFTTRPVYDAPTSNMAWGRLNLPSDGLLLHSNGKIVSINNSAHKIEVLTLPEAATNDADAPRAAVYGGMGARPGLLDSPLCIALTVRGELLVLEAGNNRIQAFDTGGNPVKCFLNGTSATTNLKYTSSAGYRYLDMQVEYTGYIYLLCYRLADIGSSYSMYLDIYSPEGQFLCRTDNFSGVKITVGYWRDLFAANLEVIKGTNGAEPVISHWIPSTPG